MDRIKEVDSEKCPQIDDRLDDLLIHQLYQTMRAFSKTLNSEIYTADVYSSEWSILKMVKKHDNISQLELANCLNVEPAAISKTIKKMEEKNLVKRQRSWLGNPLHSDCNLVGISAAGRAYDADADFKQHGDRAHGNLYGLV